MLVGRLGQDLVFAVLLLLTLGVGQLLADTDAWSQGASRRSC